MGKPLFVMNEPVMLLKKERTIVAGDLHIGIESKMGEEGIHVPNAGPKMASKLNKIGKEAGADSILFLGDIKERIGFPTSEEANNIRSFFRALEFKRIMIAKGNHDGHISEILGGMGLDLQIEKEFFIGNCAIMHGNFWPSDDAMKKKYLVMGHMHPAIKTEDRFEKIWIMAKVGKKIFQRYEKYTKAIKLILAPAFNDLIVGSGIDSRTGSKLTLFKNEIFDFPNSQVYDLQGNLLGHAKALCRD